MIVVAFVNSQGFVINKKFYCLEFTYTDIITNGLLCYRYHAFVECPFSDIKSEYPKLPINVIVNPPCPTVTYDFLVNFLRKRYQEIQKLYPNEQLVFCYKGDKHQSQVLRDANIPNILNIDIVGVPSLGWLMYMYPNEKTICSYHPKRVKQCAQRTLKLVEIFLNHNKDFLTENMKKMNITFPKNIPKIHYAIWVHLTQSKNNSTLTADKI